MGRIQQTFLSMSNSLPYFHSTHFTTVKNKNKYKFITAQEHTSDPVESQAGNPKVKQGMKKNQQNKIHL